MWVCLPRSSGRWYWGGAKGLKAKQASVNKFPILDMNGVPINLSEDENYYPHQEALEWHKKEVFNKFSL